MRTIFEAVRTSVIWVVNLLIYYIFAPHSVFGEAWTTYSYLQLCGFVMLIFSSQFYSGYVKYPMLFKYDDASSAPSKQERQPLMQDDDDDK